MNLKKINKFIKKHWFLLSSLVIGFVAASLRFYNFSNRFVLAGDQAHFALAGKYMLEQRLLPLFGPFSSAGPFQTGGEWYWFVAIGSMFKFLGVTAPWFFLIAIYVVFVFLMIVIGRKMEGKLFGLVVGCLAAVSTGEIIQAVNLSNQSPIPLFAALAILCMVLYLQTKKIRFIFLMSLMIGIASSIHLQGVALIALILVTVILGAFPGIKGFLLIPLGLVIPWVPVFIIDSQNNFANTHNMIYYFLFEKNKPSYDVLGRRWLTFIGVFAPNAWAYVIGGIPAMGYVMAILSFGFGVYTSVRRKIKRQWLVLFVTTILMYAVLRYTKTPLFESFYAFLHPFIILLTAWAILQLFRLKKPIAVVIFVCLLTTSLYTDMIEVSRVTSNINATRPDSQKNFLIKKFPQKKFAIYDYKFETSANSQSLALFLYNAGKIDDKGLRVGYSYPGRFKYPVIENDGVYTLYDLSALSAEQLIKDKWVFVNPSAIYHASQDWFRKK